MPVESSDRLSYGSTATFILTVELVLWKSPSRSEKRHEYMQTNNVVSTALPRMGQEPTNYEIRNRR